MFLLFAKFLLLFSIHMKHSFLRVMPVSCFSFTKLFAQLRLKLYPCSNFFFFFLMSWYCLGVSFQKKFHCFCKVSQVEVRKDEKWKNWRFFIERFSAQYLDDLIYWHDRSNQALDCSRAFNCHLFRAEALELFFSWVLKITAFTSVCWRHLKKPHAFSRA